MLSTVDAGADRLQVEPLGGPGFLEAATLLAEGTTFTPEVMARVLAARTAAGTPPALLGARDSAGGPLRGAAMLDLHRPVAGGRLYTRIGVQPAARGTGVARALAVHLGRLLPVGHPPLCVEVAGDDERSQAVTRRFGGVEYQRSLSLELDLTGDAWRFASLAPERAGVTVQSMRPDATEEQWQAAFAVYASASLDLPDRAGAPAPSYDMFRAQTDHSPGVHLAWRDGSPVGISGAGLDGPGAWYVFFTGTLASERRTGVARALKNALHRTAHGEGVRTLATSTLSNNTPMLTLNAALGYRITGAVARFAIG